jgi:hypothetical protein
MKVRLGLPQSRISFINILCYWCQYCFGRNFIYRSTTHILIVVAFIFGAFFSALAGNMGMKIATKTNVRTTKPHVRVCLKPKFFWRRNCNGIGCRFSGFRIDYFLYFLPFFMNGVWTSTEDMTIVLETLAFLLEQNQLLCLPELVVELYKSRC